MQRMLLRKYDRSLRSPSTHVSTSCHQARYSITRRWLCSTVSADTTDLISYTYFLKTGIPHHACMLKCKTDSIHARLMNSEHRTNISVIFENDWDWSKKYITIEWLNNNNLLLAVCFPSYEEVGFCHRWTICLFSRYFFEIHVSV